MVIGKTIFRLKNRTEDKVRLYNTDDMMKGRVFVVLVVLTGARVWADSDAAPADIDTREETTLDQEWEAKGVIPQGGLLISTQPVTPMTMVPDRNAYDQGLEELAAAQDLWKKGNAEAASDIALQSYDELVGVHMPRKNKKKRQKLRDDRHQAATVYLDSSIAFIDEYVKKAGDSTHAREEGRARLGDLRDVAQNYPELTKKLNKALEAYPIAAAQAAAPAAAPSVAVTVPASSAPVVVKP